MKKQIILEYDANTGKVEQKLDGVIDKQKEVSKGAQDMKKDYSGLTDVADRFTGGLFSGFTKGVDAIRKGVMGLQLFKSALISTGIGALVVAAGALFAAFQRIQGVQDAFKAGSAALGTVLEKVGDVVAKLGEWLVMAFKNPQQAIKDLWNLIKENIVNRFEGIIDQARALGRTLKAAFTLDWDELKAGLEDYGNALIKTSTGVEDAIGKMRDLGGEMAKAAQEAYKLAQAENALADANIAMTVTSAENNREMARNKLIAADTTKSVDERRQALEKALQIEEQQLASSIALAAEELRIQQERMSLSNSMREDYAKEAELKAKLIGLETASLEKSKEVVGQLSGFNAQIAAENKAMADKRVEAAKKRQEELAILADFTFQTFATEQEKEVAAVQKKYDEMIALAKKNRQDTTQIDEAYEAQKLAITTKYQEIADAAQKDKDDKAEAERQKILANEEAIQQALFEFRATEEQLAVQKEQEKWQKLIETATVGGEQYNQLIASQEQAIAAVQKEFSDKRLADEKALQDAKVQFNVDSTIAILGLIQQATQLNETQSRRSFNINKAASLATAGVQTALAVTAALTGGGNPAKIASGAIFVDAGIAAATGALQMVKIAKTKYNSPDTSTTAPPTLSSGGDSGASGGGGSIPAIDLSSLTQGANQTAIQAYVVAQNVSSQQQGVQLIQDQSRL
jgi:hypothetical protein